MNTFVQLISLNTTVTKLGQLKYCSNTYGLYLGGGQFESWPGYPVSRLGFLVVLLSLSK